MEQRGGLASESDEESDQDDTDEGMRSDTEAYTKQEADGTGDTKAKVGKGRKRKREAGAMEGDGLRRHVAPGGDGRTTPFGGAAPPLRGGAGGGGGGGVAGGRSWQLAESRPRQITQSHRWLAASCQCGHTRLPSRRRLA